MNTKTKKVTDVFDAVSGIQSNDKIFIHSGVSAPQRLIQGLVDRAAELKNVHVYQIHTEWDCSYAEEKYENSFTLHSFFNGSNIRKARKNINASYIPIFLSEVPGLFYNKVVQLDYALIQVSPPDEHGMVSLGPSVDVTIAAIRTAKKVIAQVNPKLPRTFGDSQFHISRLDCIIECNDPLFEAKNSELSDVEKKIGQHVATLIEDQSTLQLGIGAIPNAVLSCLGQHRDLGIHTEMFSDGIIDLYRTGVITGKYKIKHPGKIVSSFVMGTQKIYDFINNNPAVLLLDAAYTNSANIISQNPQVVAINSAIEIDLTGQICADSIGSRIYSGVGGQMDFMRGAAMSKGGKPIIALSSTTSRGVSKISAFLKQGAGVVTTRAHAHYVVTEFGIAYLHGKTLSERAAALIKIASPLHQESLERAAFELMNGFIE
jgi:4-hydroxybutyrate CoA-transferase